MRYDVAMDRSPAAADVFTPATAEELARFVTQNASEQRRPLFPVGGRTALHYGYPRSTGDVTLAISELDRVLDYPARDMTITVEAGLRIEELQKRLAAEGQRLPIDIPQAHRATVGGAIATNPSGPGRFGHGTFRDYVIGITAVDGRGRLFSAGGRVVKNVAGYDLCKLLVGSLGTLAIITQVTLKLRPTTPGRQCLWATFPSLDCVETVLELLLTSQTRPCAIEVLNPPSARQIQRESKLDLPIDRNVICLAFEGSAIETDWQITRSRQELAEGSPEQIETIESEKSRSLWSALTEYQAASDDPLTFQASVFPSRVLDFVGLATGAGIAVQCHAGTGIVIGHLPDRCSSVADASVTLAPLQEFAAQTMGSLVVLDCDDEWKPSLQLFTPPASASKLSRQVKSALDPFNLLSPGRLG